MIGDAGDDVGEPGFRVGVVETRALLPNMREK